MNLYFVRAFLFAFPVLLIASSQPHGSLPLIFEPNRGQAAPEVRFVGLSKSYSLLLTGQEAVLSRDGGPGVRMRWIGAKKPRSIQGAQATGGISNYLLGSDPSKWKTGVPNFTGVRYEAVYPGIDLVFHGDRGQLEYDFIVAPGGDSRNIQLEFEGMSGIRLDSDGNLLLFTRSGLLRQRKPVAYQEVRGEKIPVDAQFLLSGLNHVEIRVSDYDRRKPLIIDPVISFSATLGAWAGPASVTNMLALDSSGNVYVTNNAGPSFAAPMGTISVTKLNPTLSTVLYTTHFGPANTGDGISGYAIGLAVDPAGSAYVAGYTRSTSFPTTPGAFQTTGGGGQSGNNDVFMTKLSPAGDTLAYSTYLGGSGNDVANCVAVDASGSAYVAGYTSSSNFPTTPGAYQAAANGAFVTKFKPDGSGLVFSTTIGHAGSVISAIAVDSNSNVYIAGSTNGSFPVTPGAFQTTNKGTGLFGTNDGFVSKFNSSGTALLYSTLIGGSSNDFVNGLAVDGSGNAYIAGTTSSTDFPTTPSAFQTHFGGGPSDAFVVKLSADATSLVYSTYLGGTDDDRGAGIAVSGNGNAVIAGSTLSVDFPVVNAFQGINSSHYSPAQNAYVTKLGVTGSQAIFSSYLGGQVGEDAKAVTLDQSGNAYVTGYTGSPDFPLTPGTIQTDFGRSGEGAFITKITDPTSCTFSASAAQPGDGGGTISVVAPAGCFWYAVKTAPWVTFGSTTSGSGNGTVTYTYAANPGAPRSTVVGIAGQTLTLIQPGVCTYSLDFTTITVSALGSTYGPFVNTGPGCTWTAMSNAPWLTLGISGTQSGKQQLLFTTSDNTGAQDRTGTITAAGLTLTVTQSGTATTISFDLFELFFYRSGSVMTGPQTVTLSISGPGNTAWTASTNQPNITVSPTSGTGNTALRVTVGAGASSGTLTVTVAGASNSPKSLPLLVADVTEDAPFGSFDTPLNNTTGVIGAIAVTGWALDHIEVTKVDIWREPIGGESTGSNGLVYIGDAVFVAGARPDVQGRNNNTPFNYRAGWGYLMLTNELPNGDGSQGLGNGTYKIHAIAHNKGGITTDLGVKTITVDNAHAAKPFGSLDTPLQGGTASGNAYINFGWALTQNPYMIPTDGSTITAYVDGAPVGHPTYNQFRSDIASLFPGLANSGGAVGFFYLDTTKLTNGVHTISWNVFDNQGRGDGIGSRYFNVLNSGTGGGNAPEESATRSVRSSEFKLGKGADLRRPPESPALAGNGEYNIDIEQLGRIELPLGAARGYLLVNGERRPLPIGSTLKDGSFYWDAGPGFLGEYQFMFEHGAQDQPVLVRVSIRPKKYARQ